MASSLLQIKDGPPRTQSRIGGWGPLNPEKAQIEKRNLEHSAALVFAHKISVHMPECQSVQQQTKADFVCRLQDAE